MPRALAYPSPADFFIEFCWLLGFLFLPVASLIHILGLVLSLFLYYNVVSRVKLGVLSEQFEKVGRGIAIGVE